MEGSRAKLHVRFVSLARPTELQPHFSWTGGGMRGLVFLQVRHKLISRACKKPLREWGHALTGFGQGPVSNPGLESGASGVRCLCANPLGNLTTVGRPRARPLGNLTTVGHLAKVSPDLSLHFQTQKPHFLPHFTHKSHIF